MAQVKFRESGADGEWANVEYALDTVSGEIRYTDPQGNASVVAPEDEGWEALIKVLDLPGNEAAKLQFETDYQEAPVPGEAPAPVPAPAPAEEPPPAAPADPTAQIPAIEDQPGYEAPDTEYGPTTRAAMAEMARQKRVAPIRAVLRSIRGASRAYLGMDPGYATQKDIARLKYGYMQLAAQQDTLTQEGAFKAGRWTVDMQSNLVALAKQWGDQADLLLQLAENKASVQHGEFMKTVRTNIETLDEQLEAGGWTSFVKRNAGQGAITGALLAATQGVVGTRTADGSTVYSISKAKRPDMLAAIAEQANGLPTEELRAVYFERLKLMGIDIFPGSRPPEWNDALNQMSPGLIGPLSTQIYAAEALKKQRVERERQLVYERDELWKQRRRRIDPFLDQEKYQHSQGEAIRLRKKAEELAPQIGAIVSFIHPKTGQQLQTSVRAARTGAALPAAPAPLPTPTAPALPTGAPEPVPLPSEVPPPVAPAEAATAPPVLQGQPPAAPAPAGAPPPAGAAAAPPPPEDPEAGVSFEPLPKGATATEATIHMINQLDRKNPPALATRWQEDFMKTEVFRNYMQREKLNDPEIGFRKWKGDFRYRTAQGHKIERRQKDIDIMEKPKAHSPTQVAGAKVRHGLRGIFSPKDSAGRPITRWERQFVPKPKPGAQVQDRDSTKTDSDSETPQ